MGVAVEVAVRAVALGEMGAGKARRPCQGYVEAELRGFVEAEGLLEDVVGAAVAVYACLPEFVIQEQELFQVDPVSHLSKDVRGSQDGGRILFHLAREGEVLPRGGEVRRQYEAADGVGAATVQVEDRCVARHEGGGTADVGLRELGSGPDLVLRFEDIAGIMEERRR